MSLDALGPTDIMARMRWFPAILCLAVLGSVALSDEPKTDAERLRFIISRFVEPLPKRLGDKPDADAVVALGRALFYDARLSKDGDHSCNGCHDLSRYGTNGPALARAWMNKQIERDAPSVYHAAAQQMLYWDSRAQGAEAQAEAALLSPREMGMPDAAAVVASVKSVGGYGPLFKKAFPDDAEPVTIARVAAAIAAFERGLVTPAPYDRFMGGDDAALTPVQVRGGLLFQEYDCAACHTGSHFGGQMLQHLGATRPWPNRADTGYYRVTEMPAHKMFFKVAPLRNVAKTAPYFHDTSSRSLKDAVRRMAWHERERVLEDEEVDAIVAFLESLTGEIPETYVRQPELP